MQNILQCLKENQREFTQKVHTSAQKYIYREERYYIPFCLSIFYCNEGIDINTQEFENSMRKTDSLLVLNEYVWCVFLDNIPSKYHVKATENFCVKLLNANYNKKIYAATVNSEEFPEKYLEMINTLFERVRYGLHSKSDDIVIGQDYII